MTLLPHDSSAVPVFYWRGARPFPLDLGEADTGAAVVLLLAREGEVCLLPVSREANLPPDSRINLSFCADAIDAEALRLTVDDLADNGWRVVGRLDLRFTGRYAGDDPLLPDSLLFSRHS